MLIIGYKGNIDWGKVKAALRRCLDMSQQDATAIMSKVKAGQTIQITDDLVLREELKDLGVLIR